MKELSSYELCLLMYLCYKSERYSRNDLKEESFDKHLEIWTNLQNIVNNYNNGNVLIVNQIPIKNHYPLITSLSIQVKNKQLLCKFLDEYSNCYRDDVLKSYNDERLSSHELEKRFRRDIGNFRASVDKNKILKEYYVDNTKYIPIILWGLREKNIGFKDIRFSLAPTEEQLDFIPVIDRRKRKLKNNVSDNIIDFCITVDLSKFMQLRGLQKAEHDAKHNPETMDLELLELKRPEWKIFFCIYAEVKDIKPEGTYLIDKKAFTSRGIKIDSTFEKDKSHLNCKVRKIVGRSKETKRFLIKPNGDKFKIDMVLYQEFYNKNENKFIDFVHTCKAKKNLP